VNFKSISIRNFLSIAEADVPDFPQGVHLVTGHNLDMGVDGSESNAAGKSSLFDAIMWGLFGTIARDGAKADDVVNRTVGKAGSGAGRGDYTSDSPAH
jgi:DNA repair exonuclease SbcCD ATPase subunit